MRPALIGIDNLGSGELIVVGVVALLVFHREIDGFARRCLQRLLG